MHQITRCALPAFLAVLALSAPGRAGPISADAFSGGATSIGFDGLAGGDCNGCGDQVIDQFSNVGILFNNPTYPGQATAQTNATFGVPNASSPNVVWVFQGGLLGDDPAAPFQMLFANEVHRVGFDFASSVDSFLLLQAYNGNDLIESLMVLGGPSPIGLGGFAGIQTTLGITRLDVSYHPLSDPNRTLNFFIDNVRFESVPEPSTFFLGLTGLTWLAAWGLAMSRKQPRKRARKSRQY